MCWLLWAAIMPELSIRVAPWQLLPRACFLKQSEETPPLAAINTALTAGLLSPAETTTHSPRSRARFPRAGGCQTTLCPPSNPPGPPQPFCLRDWLRHLVPILTPFPTASLTVVDTLSLRAGAGGV